MKKNIFPLLFVIFIAGAVFLVSAQKRKTEHGKIFGDPTVKYVSGADLQPFELAFETPKNPVICDSELFYAVFLKSVRLKQNTDCQQLFLEADGLSIQNSFPKNKVFTLKCSEPGNIFYTNVANDTAFMCVYTGKTLSEANIFLKRVQAAGGFAGATPRQMHAGINGT